MSLPLIQPSLDSAIYLTKLTLESKIQEYLIITLLPLRGFCPLILPLAKHHQIPIVITGFEPVDLLQGIYFCIKQLESGRYEVENQYRRVVNQQGNQAAQQLLKQVFNITDQQWRGLGTIPEGGLTLTDDYNDWNAEQRFSVSSIKTQEPLKCRSGDILKGLLKPNACPEFSKTCSPEHPLGATMVSSEGACAAYYRYRAHD